VSRNYLCSVCGTPCYYDSRHDAGPVLVCDCTKNRRWIDGYDCRSGYWENINGAKPIPIEDYIPKR